MPKNQPAPFLYQITDWKSISKTEHPGESGTSWWQTLQLPGLRLRVVEYSAGYKADHWCEKGHVVYCLEGEFRSELHPSTSSGGESQLLTKGMMYVVSDDVSSHRSSSEKGATLFIVDGDFLKQPL